MTYISKYAYKVFLKTSALVTLVLLDKSEEI